MTGVTYKYPDKECDVVDKNALKTFRQKRDEWLTQLKTDKHHAISQVVQEMIWNDMSFRILARAAERDDKSCLHNSLIAETLINGHFAEQVLAIRRLMDTTKGVISLAKLLEDIKKNVHFITRENYVSGDGLPYDYESVMHKEIIAKANNGPYWVKTTGPTAWASSQLAHKAFDRLCEIGDPAQRKRSDTLPVIVIEKLIGKLNGCGAGQVATWSHNFLAHAAPEHRRQSINLEAAAPTLRRIGEAIQCFVQVTEVLLADILNDSCHGAVVAVPQYNQFEHLGSPLFAASNGEGVLRAYWDELEEERNKYLEDAHDILK